MRKEWKRIRLFLLLLSALTVLILLRLFRALPPAGICRREREESVELPDHSEGRALLLRGAFSLRGKEKILFQTERGWRVSDFLIRDIDRDGKKELLLLLWKRGSYGPDRPYWVRKNDRRFSQHIFIYRFEEERLKPIWMSSALGMNIKDWSLSRDAVLCLVTKEGRKSFWVYRGFGLKEYTAEGEERKKSVVRLFAAGDVILHRGILRACFEPRSKGYDFRPLYRHVREKIRRFDLSIVNQETILTEDPARYGDYPRFGTPIAAGDSLRDAGFNVVTAATNHAFDQGEQGIWDTLSYWEKHPEVRLLGLNGSEREREEIPYLRRNGIRFALFNTSYGLNDLRLPKGKEWMVNLLSEKELLLSQLREAEEKADFSICLLHIGEEYVSKPDEEERRLMEELCSAGADLILCTHSHVVGPVEKLELPDGKAALVYYGLGNFLSNQTKVETVLGGAAELLIEKREGRDGRTETGISDYRFLPVFCHWGKGKTESWFLSDYPEELFESHFLYEGSRELDKASLRALFLRESGLSEERTRPLPALPLTPPGRGGALSPLSFFGGELREFLFREILPHSPGADPGAKP